MNLEDRIRFDLKYWYEIFSNRGSVLDHYFCVIGSGLEWQNGQLVNIFPDTDQQMVDDYNQGPNSHPLADYMQEGDDAFNAMLENVIQDRKKYRPNTDEEVERRAKDVRYNNFYPLSEKYSPLFTVPDDVQPDWLAGAYETIELILSCTRPFTSKEGLRHETTRQNNLVLAAKAKQLLDQRFS